MKTKFNLAALFLLSISLITFELYIMRVFSIGNWSNFGALIISTALMGFGVSGTLLTLIRKWVLKHGQLLLFITAVLFSFTMVLSHMVGQIVPFNPMFISSDPGQVLLIGLYYLVYGVPFLFGAFFIGISFMLMGKRIYHLYFWNMLGSGLGGFLLIFLMFLLPPESIIIPVMILGFAASILTGVSVNEESQTVVVPVWKLGLAGVLFLVSMVLIINWENIRVSEFKPISYIKNHADARKVHHSYGPSGVMDVFEGGSQHFAPGLSDNASSYLDSTPSQAFLGLYIDGSGPIGIMGDIPKEEAEYFNFLPVAAPYKLLNEPRCLLVNLGGGINAQVARYNEASEIVIYEQNPEIADLLKNDPYISDFTGNLLEDELIDLHIGDARSHCVDNPGSYDLVEISLIDSIGLSDTGGYAITENYTYTVESITEYMSSLKDDGMLSITVWNRLNPPRNIPKLLTTIVSAMRSAGMESPEKNIFMFDLLHSTATILVKKSPFTLSEQYDLEKFCGIRSFNVAYTPEIEQHDGSIAKNENKYELETLLEFYRSQYEEGASTDLSLQFGPADFYRAILNRLLSAESQAQYSKILSDLYSSYIFDIRPVRDQRPYYTGYLKLNELPLYLDQIGDISEEWGYLLILGILLQSIFFGLLIIGIPVIGRFKELVKRERGTSRVILYYALLGLGFMLLEIYLIQRLVLFLSNPIYSVSIVITSMLIVSGIGNLTSRYFSPDRTTRVRIACVGIGLSVLFYLFFLTPILSAFISLPMIARIVISILLIAPGAFFLGMPFPNGLDALNEKRPLLLPWAWGMNGGLSVTGTALAQIISVSLGFPVLLVLVILVYAGVAVLFPVNEIEAASK